MRLISFRERYVLTFSIVLLCTTAETVMRDDRHPVHIVTQEWMEDFAEGKLKDIMKNVVLTTISEDHTPPQSKKNMSTSSTKILNERKGYQKVNVFVTSLPLTTLPLTSLPLTALPLTTLSFFILHKDQKSLSKDCSSVLVNEKHREMTKARATLDNHIPKEATKDNKVIVFVTGPESTGNRYTVDVLVKSAGCAGKSGHVQPLDHKGRGKKKDWSTLDKKVLWTLKNTTCAVIHRSFPHNNNFVDLKRMAQVAREKDFEPHVLVLTRFMPAIIKSQLARKHVRNAMKARENIKRAYLEILDDVIGAKLSFTIVTYELLEDKDYIRWLFNELAIHYDPNKVPKFKEANSKHIK
ncbi:MAG: hypothetical protein ACTSUE_15225 [Promethearchaeota archaeon]